MMEEKKYPIAEIFVSPQGEGVYTGVMMTFVRLAGCTVGKPFPKERYEGDLRAETADGHKIYNEPNIGLPLYTEECTLYDGRKFACDTDYRVKERLTAKEILERVDTHTALITGGEPLMHDIGDLVRTIQKAGKRVHIETSGTKKANVEFEWMTISPKINPLASMIAVCDELKILVDPEFDVRAQMNCIKPDGTTYGIDLPYFANQLPIYLQPVNFENKVNPDNLRLCLELQKQYPQFRVSPQMHKVMGMIIKEIIR